MSKCPTCEKAAKARAENPAFPFCSDRCRLLDLGRWLGEGYRIPVQRADEEDDELPSVAQRPSGTDEHGDA